MAPDTRPHIAIVVAGGEAVRNFLYSDTARMLNERARVTMLSAIDDDRFVSYFDAHADEILPLPYERDPQWLRRIRQLSHTAHFRWIWSEVAKNNEEMRDAEATTTKAKAKRIGMKVTARALGHRKVLRGLTWLDRKLSYRYRPTTHYDDVFTELAPDLVFNTMHVHRVAADLPMRVAHAHGIRTAAFVFSWDNLTSRSRIFVPYDDFLVWSDRMKGDLLEMYEQVTPEAVHVTGTPQFDFHSKPEFILSREALASRIGFDPSRPFVLYTTGLDRHFPEEHRTVLAIHRILSEMPERPQLVVRNYIKGISDEMQELMDTGLSDTFFPPIGWDPEWYTPAYDDVVNFSSLLHHCAMGVNAASTVSLELLALGKPVMNLGLDPPGSTLDHPWRWARHIWFDHYRPVAESGAVMVAWSEADLERYLHQGIRQPELGAELRQAFVSSHFGDAFDGSGGARVAEALLAIAESARS